MAQLKAQPEQVVEKQPRTIREIIRQRRMQMLTHSYLYYTLGESIVSDDRWQRWADELERIQKEHPEECAIGFYDAEFVDWSGATGMHLPRDEYVRSKADFLLRYQLGQYR